MRWNVRSQNASGIPSCFDTGIEEIYSRRCCPIVKNSLQYRANGPLCAASKAAYGTHVFKRKLVESSINQSHTK
jgi:hypothetical protein